MSHDRGMYLDPDWATSALLIIDVQNDFASGPSAVAGTADRIPGLARLATSFRAVGRPIVHVVRSYRAGESDVDLVRRAAIESGDAVVQPGTTGADIPGALLPHDLSLDWNLLRSGEIQQIGPEESVMYKPRWSAFHRTPLDRRFRDLGIDTVVVAGCNLPNCPRATLFDASERDYRTVLVVDATSQTTPERLADLELIGVRLRTVDDAVAELSVIPPAPGAHRREDE
ncbi:isochorismatase family cysteine hydrolase [Gordonia malaquae]|uniref:cysteine hydrolase family protein n=1 Tax=Gordonia malaquae TaxID=410332 RepID=UPI0030FE3ECC